MPACCKAAACSNWVFITLPLELLGAAQAPERGEKPHKIPLKASAAAPRKTEELNSYLYKLQNYVINSLHRYAGVLLEEFSIEVSQFT